MMITRTAIALALLVTSAACGTPAPREPAPATYSAEDVSAESERLNAWFEATFDAAVARDPMRQTYLGIKDRYGEWSDASEAFELQELELQRASVAEMKSSFNFDKLDDQAKLSWRLAEYELERAEAAFPFRSHSYTFNQMFGVQSGIPAFLINQHKVATASDAEAYISRLNGVPAYLGQHVENSKASAAQGILPPGFVFEYVLADARGVITGYPFTGTGDGTDEEDTEGLEVDVFVAADVLLELIDADSDNA
jgi:uncharacterized protein (DUF885 family)